jgi:hypothetical protein
MLEILRTGKGKVCARFLCQNGAITGPPDAFDYQSGREGFPRMNGK